MSSLQFGRGYWRLDGVPAEPWEFASAPPKLAVPGIANSPEHFEDLFAMHTAFTWAENLERLVEATTAIVARNQRFNPTAAAAIDLPRFAQMEEELRTLLCQRGAEILEVAAVENVNLRGNRIERLLTGAASQHELGDLRRALDGGELAVDVKTKLADRLSAPKAYNIDKMSRSQPGAKRRVGARPLMPGCGSLEQRP